MIAVLGALLPLFVLIALGYLARRIGWPGPRAWRSIERLTYYILFPALLFTSLAGTSLAGGGVVALALALATVATAVASLLTHRPLALSGPTLTSVIQGAVGPTPMSALARRWRCGATRAWPSPPSALPWSFRSSTSLP